MTVTSRKALSLFSALNSCCSPIVMAMTLCTRACTFIRFSFSEAKRDITPVAVVNAPDRPFTPEMKPCRLASSLARILVCARKSPRVSESSAAFCAICRYSSVFCSPFRRIRAMSFCSSRSWRDRRLLLSLLRFCASVRLSRMPFLPQVLSLQH